MESLEGMWKLTIFYVIKLPASNLEGGITYISNHNTIILEHINNSNYKNLEKTIHPDIKKTFKLLMGTERTKIEMGK